MSVICLGKHFNAALRSGSKRLHLTLKVKEMIMILHSSGLTFTDIFFFLKESIKLALEERKVFKKFPISEGSRYIP